MTEVYHMKALRTFYGTGGYIVAGQEFFTTSKEQADMYVQEEIAVYTDGTEVGTDAEQEQDIVNQSVVYTSQLERNVTSMANPVNLRISVQGMNPDDLTVEVVRDQEVQPQTMTVEPKEQQQVQPSQQQQYQGGYEQQQVQEKYEQQYVQPSSPQHAGQGAKQQEMSQSNEDPQNADLGEAGSFQQQQQAGYDSTSQASEEQPSNGNGKPQLKSFEDKEAELLQQLEELRAQKEQYSQSQMQGQSEPSPEPSQGGALEVKHVGGGWYDLPTGERIQGKQNAEARLQELIHAYQHSQQAQLSPQELQSQDLSKQQGGYQPRMVGQAQFPNPERVRQANTQPEDGASLNQASLDYVARHYQGQGGQVTGQGNVQAQGQGQQGNGSGMAQGFNQSGDQRGVQAQSQPRNSEGEFTSQGTEAGGTRGATGSGNGGSGGNSSGASTSNNTGGGNTSGTGGTGGNTSGPNSGSGGGASTSGNTGQ